MNQCPNCGAYVNPGARFCTNCAAPMPMQGYVAGPAPRAKSSMPIIVGAILLVSLIGGGIAAYFLLFNKPTDAGAANSNTAAANSNSSFGSSDRGSTVENSNRSSGMEIARTPRDAAEKFIRAVESGDTFAVRRLVAQSAQDKVEGITNDGSQDIKKRGGIESINISNEREDDDAVVLRVDIRYRNGSTDSGDLIMIEEDGSWKLKQVAEAKKESDPSDIPPPLPPPPLPPPPLPPPDDPKTAAKIIRKSTAELQSAAIKRVQPAYPPLARAARVGGAVVVEVTIDEMGDVVSARALAGHPLLKDAAVNAARGWKFRPTPVDGQPVRIVGTITFNFNL